MTVHELLEELRRRHVKVILRDGDVLNIEPKTAITPELHAALVEHKAVLITLLRGPRNGPPSFDSLLAALYGLDAHMPPHTLEGRLRALAADLNGVDPLTRELVRAEAIARLERLHVRSPARLIDAALAGEPGSPRDGDTPGRRMTLRDPEPWPERVEGAGLVDEMAATFTRYVAVPLGAVVALTLWIIHTYVIDASDISPYLVLTSPERRCGKTTALQVAAALAPRALAASNITPAALFRAVETYAPTLFIDEADTFLAETPELRGLLNSGHTRATAFAVRTVGEDHEARLFSTWCPKLIALIGPLPSTLEDRAIVIPMRRRGPSEPVDRFRLDHLNTQLDPLRRRIARWATDHMTTLREADPRIPDELHDRAADNWRPLLAIADLVGGDWPERAREAARRLSGVEHLTEDSARVELLADLRDLFVRQRADRLATAMILDDLHGRDERPWATWNRGKPLTARQLATLLTPFGVRSKQIREGDDTRKGYHQADLVDAFGRYLPPLNPKHAKHPNGDADFDRTPDPKHPADVSDPEGDRTARQHSDVSDVSDQHPTADEDPTEPLPHTEICECARCLPPEGDL